MTISVWADLQCSSFYHLRNFLGFQVKMFRILDQISGKIVKITEYYGLLDNKMTHFSPLNDYKWHLVIWKYFKWINDIKWQRRTPATVSAQAGRMVEHSNLNQQEVCPNLVDNPVLPNFSFKLIILSSECFEGLVPLPDLMLKPLPPPLLQRDMPVQFTLTGDRVYSNSYSKFTRRSCTSAGNG